MKSIPIPPLTAAQKEKYDILFPELSTYRSPPILLDKIKWFLLAIVSFILSTTGLLVLAIFATPTILKNMLKKEPLRPFQTEETTRSQNRQREEAAWKQSQFAKKKNRNGPDVGTGISAGASEAYNGYLPTGGGKDEFVRKVGYYARRMGLECEEIKVQTEDGFILDLWHVFDKREGEGLPVSLRGIRGPECVDDIREPSRKLKTDGNEEERGRKFPVLLIHGLLQSSGVYATNDEHSLAFWLCKEGFDVWLGSCRAGFEPGHVELKSSDPGMWNWDLRHMATMDLPALIARVLSETSFPKLALVGHSQGTTATLIALSRFGRPSLSEKISVACLLAPAFYAGSLLSTKAHFKLMRVIPRSFFTLIFGRTSFLPIMGVMKYLHGRIPANWIGGPSYAFYQFFFDWSDRNWERGMRNRGFSFAPTYLSAKCMEWWLGRGGFADRGCVLSTKEEVERESIQDLLEDFENGVGSIGSGEASVLREKLRKEEEKGLVSECWYPENTAPMAFWVAENDELVDGKRLLNRFRRGREQNVKVLHEHVVGGYEHLDVIWSCDVIEKVGWVVRDVIWNSVESKDDVRVPRGCVGSEKRDNDIHTSSKIRV